MILCIKYYKLIIYKMVLFVFMSYVLYVVEKPKSGQN